MASRNDFNELSEIYVVEFDGTVSDYVGPASQISKAVMADGPMGLALFVTRPGADGSHLLDTWAVRGDEGEPIVSISYSLEGGCLVIKHRDGNVLRAYGPRGWLEVSRHGGRKVFLNKDGSRGAS